MVKSLFSQSRRLSVAAVFPLNTLFALSSLFVAVQSFALDYEQSVDVSLTLNGQGGSAVAGLPAEQQLQEFEAIGQADLFWNMSAYFFESIDLNIRYGLSAQSVLDENGTAVGQSLGADYRVDDLPSVIDVSYFQTLDTANINFNSPMGIYTLGRQAISFGQAKFYSPIDVMQPTKLFSAASAYRSGVDAIRGTWQLGAVSEFDAGYIFGNDTAYFGRLKLYLFNSDFEFVGIQINDDNHIVSIGLNSGIGSIGLWQETAWLQDNTGESFRVTVGVDTIFLDDWYVVNEVHYNGLGEPNDYSLNESKTFYQLGAVLPQAQWYNSTQINYPLNILTSLNVGTTVNLNDMSALFNTALNYSATDSLTVTASGLIPVAQDRSIDYEYGMYPYAASLKLDWVF